MGRQNDARHFFAAAGEPGLLYKIAVENGYGDGVCYARVERATATDVLISCTPEKAGPEPNRKFVYDSRAKALIKRVDYDPFGMHRVFVSGEKAILVGSDRHRLVAVEYHAGQEPAFRLLGGAEAESWTRLVPFTTGAAGAGPEQRRQIYLEPREFKPARFGPGNRFTVSLDEKANSSEQAKMPVVLERIGGRVKRFPLHQGDEFNEKIGPWRIAEGTLWFAKTFYDGEGRQASAGSDISIRNRGRIEPTRPRKSGSGR